MRERDLRRQALESGKTTSRKAKAKALSSRSSQAGSVTNSPAQSPVVSPEHSPGTSRNGSCNVSRHGSEEDNDDSEDELNTSVASLDIGSFSSFDKAPYEVWRNELRNASEQIIERSRNKRNTAEAREEMLAIYTNILRAQYAAEELESHLDDLIPALLKSFRSGSGEQESSLALKALAMTILTTGEALFEEVHQPLRSRIQDSSSASNQASAIQTLAAATFFGGADMQDADDVTDQLLDIIETDGESIDAGDNAAVVAAALQGWGLIATMFSDLEGKIERPLECFTNQLESSNLEVQKAAMENIALIYEQSYVQAEEGEEADYDQTDLDEYESGKFKRKHFRRRYAVLRSGDGEYSLKSQLAELSRSIARHVQKDKRKDLHQIAKDVLHTVEHPYRGPRYSTALNEELTQYMGHRYVIRFGGKGSDSLVIDRWWKLHRYEAIKRLVAGGIAEHLQRNPVVRDCLPRNALDAPTEF